MNTQEILNNVATKEFNETLDYVTKQNDTTAEEEIQMIKNFITDFNFSVLNVYNQNRTEIELDAMQMEDQIAEEHEHGDFDTDDEQEGLDEDNRKLDKLPDLPDDVMMMSGDDWDWLTEHDGDEELQVKNMTFDRNFKMANCESLRDYATVEWQTTEADPELFDAFMALSLEQREEVLNRY